MHKYIAELRIWGEDLDIAEITDNLGLEPSLVLRRGDKLGRTKHIKESVWSYSGIVKDQKFNFKSLEENLSFLLEKLWPVKDKIEAYKSKYKIVLWCGHFQDSYNGGPLLSAPILRLLGEFGVDLFIDNYFSGKLKADVTQ
jgi:hypothetical protein